LAAALAAMSPALAASAARPAAVFQKYCFECHGNKEPEAGLSLEQLVAKSSVGVDADDWEKVAEMLESAEMPPKDAKVFPTDAERKTAATWVRSSLKAYATEHAGEPGKVTVRRLTSGEYAYAIRDLTGVDIKVGIDASSDAVGGEGFTNFGDVQFVQDASIERYLEAAKRVADHAVLGSGPLEFYTDPGRTGLELSALYRINQLYDANGFRVASGEGGRPFGLERYGKALYVAWYFKHRVALGEPKATVRDLAARHGITGRFADHIWTVMNKPNAGYPTNEMIGRWKKFPAPTADIPASVEKAKAASEELYKYLSTWPSWFFARGDLAAGGAGDETPIQFDDSTLKAAPTHKYTYPLGGRGRGPGAAAAKKGKAPPAGPTKVFLQFANVNPSPGVKPVVIWRNPRVITRQAPPPGRGGAPGADAAAVVPPAGRGRGPGLPILKTEPLRTVLAPEMAAAFGFGTSPDGSKLGPDDFATTGPVAFEVPPAANGTLAEFQVDAELGADRNGVVRLMLADRAEGAARGPGFRVILGDPASDGYKTYRAGIAEYAALLPPNSHGEANPADRDPVPLPFDNTYNGDEHDTFILKVKYQRTDQFFTENMVDGADRVRLNHAWNDLFGSWFYHDAYLFMLTEHYQLKLSSPRIKDVGAAEIAALPEEPRKYIAPLRVHYDQVMKAMKDAEPGHIEDAIAFAGRAWRRPLTNAEKSKLRAFYQRTRKENGLEHDEAVRAVLARVLISPEFLYRVETGAARTERPLNDWEMASRLSFFLWASVPDEELRRAAVAGELSKPAMIAKQVKRMTADPKARRIATEFFGQWLGFYHFDEFRGVDTTRFPEFTEEVRKSMYDEAVTTFEYLVRQERPLKEMLHADYTFLNQPLAKFYGIEKEIKSTEAVERVEGANAFNRGGALRLGSVLTTTSAPLRTSPVKRGDWLLRRILGTPTPPPPADAGSLPSDPKEFGQMTLRQRLTEHKRNETCAACHLKIDPLGFPLEAFDAVGRPRKEYEDQTPVDTTGEFADKSTIVGAEGLLKYLEEKEPQVMKTFARKLVGYALGRTVLASDRALVDELVAAGGQATFSDLAVKIATSRQFRNHQGRGDFVPGVAAGN
jgi:mono/diheme cytochrome c family protein